MLESRSRWGMTAGALMTLWLQGCSDAPGRPAAGGGAPQTVVAQVEPRDETPLTDEECLQFAMRLEERIGNGERSALEEAIDRQGLAERIARLAGVKSGDQQTFVNGFLKTFRPASTIWKEVEAGGRLRLLRIHRVDGVPRALFRLTTELRYNYFDFVMKRHPRGGVQIDDFYSFSAGDLISGVCSQMAADLLGQAGQRPDGEQPPFAVYSQRVRNVREAMLEGRAEDAWRQLETIPESIRKTKAMMVIRLSICAQLGGDRLQQAMQDFSAAYPKDPAVDFFLANVYSDKGEYAEAIEAIERLQSKLGGDPYLDVQRAQMLFDLKRPQEAENAIQKALEQEPDLLDAYWLLVDISLKQQDFERTVDLLITLEEDLGVEMRDLESVPVYADFVKSAEHRHWQRQRAAKAEDDAE